MTQLIRVCLFMEGKSPISIVFTFLGTIVNSFKKSLAMPDFNIDDVGDWTCSTNAKNTENNIKVCSYCLY